jgi:hypothetical protein
LLICTGNKGRSRPSITQFTSKNCGYGSVGERSACSTMDQAKQFYTDYLFTCNQRSFMDELAARNNPS